MEILVFVKQVPDDSVDVEFNASTKKAEIEKIATIVNPFDGYALEMATRFKEKNGGNITVVSLGDEQVVNSIRNCLAVGGNSGFAIVDKAFENSDSMGTSYILSKAIEKVSEIEGKKFDMILCGIESTDFTSGQVGAQISEILEIPQITSVVDIDLVDGTLQAKQETEEGYKTIQTTLPSVLTIAKPDYEPRYPTMKNKMAARKIEIAILSNSDLGVDESKIGENGALIKEVDVFAPNRKRGGTTIKEETTEETGKKAVSMMEQAKVF